MKTPKNGRKPRGFEDFEPVAPLETSSSSWAAQQKAFREEKQVASSDGTESNASILRQIRAILNKLTLERFTALLQQLMSCGISTQEHLEILMHEIMEKATTQHHFISMYTELCVVLHDWCSQNQIGDSSKGSFKRILLTECQGSFNRYLVPPDHLKTMKGDELAEAEVKYKTQKNGNIKFVGALLAKKMVASQVIISVTQQLLAEPVRPDALETLAAFLTTVGGIFDRPDWQHREQLSKVFDRLAQLSRDSDRVPSRIRCLLSDVLDLRKANWKDTKQATKGVDGPMTIEEVHGRAAGESHRSAAPRTPGSAPRPGYGAAPSVNRGARSSGTWPTNGGTVGGGAGAPLASPPRASPTSRGAQQVADSPSLRNGGAITAAARGAAAAAPASAGGSGGGRGGLLQGSAWGKGAPGSGSSATNGGAVPLRGIAQLRKELAAAVKEVSISYDVPEAICRVRELQIPVEHHGPELAHVLAQIAEERNIESRAVSFRFAVHLFLDGVFEKSELLSGLEKLFGKSYEELRVDMPALPGIMRNECLPALAELVQRGLLSAEQHEVFTLLVQ